MSRWTLRVGALHTTPECVTPHVFDRLAAVRTYARSAPVLVLACSRCAAPFARTLTADELGALNSGPSL